MRRQDGGTGGLAGHRSFGDVGHRPVPGARTPRHLGHRPSERGDLDLLDPVAVGDAVAAHDVVVNCAAWTAVDAAETHEEEAAAINAVAPGVLARAAAEHGRLIVQVSTDYVFDGTRPDAVRRGRTAGVRGRRTDAPRQPVSRRCGRRRRATIWWFARPGCTAPTAPASRGRSPGWRESVATCDVVDDQVGQPTWTVDVAELIVRLVESAAPAGTWHATSAGETSWFGFARRVVEAAGLSPAIVEPTTTAGTQARLRRTGRAAGVLRAGAREAARPRHRGDRPLGGALAGSRFSGTRRRGARVGTPRSRT